MKRRLLIWLRNFFGFSRSESNGFIVIVILMVFSVGAFKITDSYFSNNSQPLQSKSDREVRQQLLNQLKQNISPNEKRETEDRFENQFTKFDLNLASSPELEEAGFPAFLAKRIVKYRKQVKPFDHKEELLKIYGLDSTLYQQALPFIEITALKKTTQQNSEAKYESYKQTERFNENSSFEKEKPPLQAIAINQADTTELQKIYGIGPAFSHRIITYKELLGGYASLQQLGEVYGLEKERLDSLKKYTYISAERTLQQLKINHIHEDSLSNHPYISYKQAKLIHNYRKQHGNYRSAEDLLKIKVLDSTWLKKILPYLSFEQ